MMTGIFKDIKVKVWEHDKDSSKYMIELFDYEDDLITWQQLESAGFVEYLGHWYRGVPKGEVEIDTL